MILLSLASSSSINKYFKRNMRLLSDSTPIGWKAKHSLKSFFREKREGANSDIFDRDECIDFGSINTGSNADENLYTDNDGFSIPSDRKSSFSEHTGTRDEDLDKLIFEDFDKVADENREQSRSASKNSTPGGSSTKTAVRKWETFIRSNLGDENYEKKLEFDVTKKNSSRLRKARSVGVLSSKLITPNPKSGRRSFGLGDITNHSTASKPTRGRRSFGLSDLNALFPTSTTEQISNDISKLALQGSISKKKKKKKKNKTNSLQKTNPMTGTSYRTSTSSVENRDGSYDGKPLERKTAASPDSDGSGFKKLLNLWNHSPEQIQKAFSKGSLKKQDDVVKIISNDSRGSPMNISNIERETAPRDAPDSGVSNGFIDSKDDERNKLTFDGNLPMRALVILERRDNVDLVVGEVIQNSENEEQLVIQNLTRTTENIECDCSRSAFSGNEDLISFFLPQMGMACNFSHNKRKNKLVNPDDPTALENILRPWQVNFLKSFDIHRGEEFVKARRQSPSILSRGLRQWRKKNDMISFKTTSCATALQIWSKVCKSYVRSIRRQTLAEQKNIQVGPADATLVHEMTQFLNSLPTAPKRRYRVRNDAPAIDPESQFEI